VPRGFGQFWRVLPPPYKINYCKMQFKQRVYRKHYYNKFLLSTPFPAAFGGASKKIISCYPDFQALVSFTTSIKTIKILFEQIDSRKH